MTPSNTSSDHRGVTWLHISDLHFSASPLLDRDVVVDALASSVRRRRDQGYPLDLIILSGDVAHSGKPSEYRVATEWLRTLLDAADLGRERLFVIPGNHDVDRGVAPGGPEAFDSILESDEYLAPGRGRPPQMARLASYQAWYDEFFEGVRAQSHSTCGPVEVVAVAGRRIGILPINSALFCRGDQDHSNLWIGRLCLEESARQLSVLDPDLRIAVMHHPIDWLAPEERIAIRRTLADSVDVILRGHVHDSDLEQVSSHGASTLTFAAGAVYQTRRLPNGAMYVTVRGTELAVAPIRYADTPQRRWVAAQEVFGRELTSTKAVNLGSVVIQKEPPVSAQCRGPGPSIQVGSYVPLVGRREDLDWLEMRWAEAQGAVRQIAVIQADKGIGKTRLALAWAEQRADDSRTLFGDARTSGPYEPLAGALRGYLTPAEGEPDRLPFDALQWLVGPDGGELTRLLPDVPRALCPPRPPDYEEAPGRYRLLEAIRAVFGRLCSAFPTTLIIDNAQLLTEDGLKLLEALLTLDREPLLVLLLMRPPKGTAFENQLPRLRRSYNMHERTIGPLDRTDADRLSTLFSGLLSNPEAPTLTQQAVRKARGVPVRLENLALRPRSGRLASRDPEYAVLRALPPAERRLLDVAALAPERVRTATLAAATGVSVDAAMDALVGLETKGQLAHIHANTTAGDLEWYFTHPTRRDAALELMDDGDAAALSGRLAAAMEKGGRYQPSDIAAAYLRSGSLTDAFTWLVTAGQVAMSSTAYADAELAFSSALRIAQQDAAVNANEPELANDIGACLWSAGRFRDARLAYKNAAAIARSRDDPLQLAIAALGRAGRFGFEGPSGGAEVAATCRVALDALEASEPSLRARLLAALSHSVKFSEHGTLDDVLVHVLEAQQLARSVDDTELLVEVLCTTSWAIWVPENLAARASLAAEAVRRADEVARDAPQKEVLQLESRLFSMTCNLEAGDLRSARADCDAITQLAYNEKSPYYLALAAMTRASLALLDGSNVGEPAVLNALRVAQREHSPSLVRVFGAQIFYSRMLQGRLEELHTAAVCLAEYDTAIVAWRSGLAVLLAETGRTVEAQRELDWASAGRFKVIPRDTFWLIAMDSYARVATTLQDVRIAEILVELLAPHEAQFVVAAGAGAVYGPVALNLGVLHGTLGHESEARRLLQRAHEMAQSSGCQPAAAEALVEEAFLMANRAEGREPVGQLAARLDLAVGAVERINSRKLAVRAAAAIQLCYTEAAAADDGRALSALERMSERLTTVVGLDAGVKGRPFVRKTVAPAMMRAIKILTARLSDAKTESLLSHTYGQRGVLTAMQQFYQADLAYPGACQAR